jgi:hypothetical protein
MHKFSEKLICPVYGGKFIETYAIMASARQDGYKKRKLPSAKPRKEKSLNWFLNAKVWVAA